MHVNLVYNFVLLCVLRGEFLFLVATFFQRRSRFEIRRKQRARVRTLDLNDLIHTPGWVLNFATSINDSAQIVGYGTLNGVAHGFLLSVVPQKSNH